jgi:hypothetical protein
MEQSINDVTALGGGVSSICDNSTKALLLKRMSIGGGSKIIKNCVTSFMDDPYSIPQFFGITI